MPGWRRTLQTIFLSQVLTIVGFSCVFPFFPLFIQTLGISGSAVVLWSGVITFAGSFTLAIASPIWGSLADRYGRKPMLVRAMAGGALVTALLIVAPNIWVVLVLRVVQGTLTGTVAPARALVAATVPRDELAYGMGLMEASVFAGSAVGPLVGGFLNDRLGFHGTFAVGAAMLLIAALLIIFRIEERFTPPDPSTAHRRPGFLAGLRDMAAIPGLALLALTILGANFATAVASPVLPLLVPELSGVPAVGGVPQTATTVGAILAVAGLCATIAAARTRWFTHRFGYRRALIGALGGAALFSAPVALVGNVWGLLVLRAAAGLCIGVALPSISALVSLSTPEARRGAIFGVLASAELTGFAVGPLVGGAVGAAVGLRAVFVITGVALLGIAILVAARVHITPPADAPAAAEAARPAD
jgi:DHA1 family multidrug resistance protein-like MFS transporter